MCPRMEGAWRRPEKAAGKSTALISVVTAILGATELGAIFGQNFFHFAQSGNGIELNWLSLVDPTA